MRHKIKIVHIYFISIFLDNLQIILCTDIERELFGDGEFSISEKVISFFFPIKEITYIHIHLFHSISFKNSEKMLLANTNPHLQKI